ncbi:glycolate oxidase [Sphaerisporangium rufum]|uniref:Glycolate oxidase n=1 Tax=Sphaerisporangium rufum TaxID=1381558 RepID=A0A919V5H0_9ACTN|nr:FAD-binding oxidoreductase [Sphaerisporangium rufum]GII78300.1 glycolate oxidase [Sphaerisporangium rufum]
MAAPASREGEFTVDGVPVRAGGPADAVAGVVPRWVALPGSTTEVAAVLRAAAARDLAVLPAGGRATLHWGPPPERCDLLLDTGRLDRVLEHAAGDLVARTQAGVPMAALAATLAGAGQELALDVPVPGATVGGTLAGGLAGPRRLRYGTARDLLIGVTVVLADGTVARSGGKVVKNVAGYDLGKLFTGSHGTLGVIAEATFRLHPLPAGRAFVTVTVPDPAALPGLAAVAASPAEPSAVELELPDLSGPATLAVLVEGVAAAERAEVLRRALGPRAAIGTRAPAWWGRPPDGGHLLELRVPPAAVRPALAAIGAAAGDLPVAVRGSACVAVLYLALPGDVPPAAAAAFVAAARAAVAPLGGRLPVVAAPPAAAAGLDMLGPVGAAALMRRVKDRFDPEGRMAPGRLLPAAGGTTGGPWTPS